MDLQTDPIVGNKVCIMVAEAEEAIRISNNYSGRNYRPRNKNNREYQTNNRYNDRSNDRREGFNQDYGQRNRNRSVSRECNRSRPRYKKHPEIKLNK